MNFWKGQSFGMQSLGDATILVSGHYHHLRTIQDGLRTWIQVPSLDKVLILKNSLELKL
ncbi:hypothetical protein [uncultured phage MedDCM-OCT-S08-C495]|nr:hypothetical protein [uncultured phage MedDCM-OCT-S08-C495]